jgi:photosystem II stability/assembly factor-like uncharacterized protein
MADVQFDIHLKNAGTDTEGLTLFAPVNASAQKANKYSFTTPYSATYNSGTIFSLVDAVGTFSITIDSELTMAQVIDLLNALNIGTFLLAYNDSTNGNVFHFLSTRNPQTLSIDNNDYTSGIFTQVATGLDPQAKDIVFVNENIILIPADQHIQRSTDGGDSFTEISLPGIGATAECQQISFIDELIGFVLTRDIAAAPRVTQVYKTIDAGASWTLIATHLSYYLSGIKMLDENNGFLYGRDENGAFAWRVFSTNDGGLSFSTIQTIGDNNGFFQFVNADYGFIFLDNSGYVLKTTDGGASWSSKLVGSSRGGFALDQNNIYIAGSVGNVHYSSDNGLNYNNIGPSDIGDVQSVYAFSTSHIMIGRNGYYYRTTNGGSSWDSTEITGAISGIMLNFYSQYKGIAHNSDGKIYKYE